MRLFIAILFLFIITLPCQSSAKNVIVDFSTNDVTAKDISWIPLGNSRGFLEAVETPAGLPIIFSLRSHINGPSVITGDAFLSLNYYENGKLLKTNWQPWALVFADGMQPVVSCKTEHAWQTTWPKDMKPVSRQWIENSNILQTVCMGKNFQLTTVDFVASDMDVLVRKFTVKNISDHTLFTRLFHYAPLNPSGVNPASWSDDWFMVKSRNNAFYDQPLNSLVFTADSSNWWAMTADQLPSQYQCAIFPATQNSISAGNLSLQNRVTHTKVDAALAFDSPQLAPGDDFSVTVYVSKVQAYSKEKALQQFSQQVQADAEALQQQTRDFWKTWLTQAKIPHTKNPELRHLIERLLMVMKASSWQNGEISAVPAELSQFYTRDAMRPAVAFALFGMRQDAKNVILAKQAYITKYGIRNHDVYEPDIAAIIAAGFDERTRFGETELFSVDDPALILYAIYHIWQTDPNETEFIRQTWPLVQYILALGKRDSNDDGMVAQNAGFQDDMLKWAFGRGDDIRDDKAGIVTSYFNMLWSVAFNYGNRIAQALGKEHLEYKRTADYIKTVLEEKYWNDDLNRYAYFYDPSMQDKYYRGTDFKAVKDDRGGQYVFPAKPLIHGITLPYWFNYDAGEHAVQSFELAKSMIEPLPESLGELQSAEMAVIYIRYLYAKIIIGEISSQDIDWFVRQIPLAGVPECFPTNNRAVQTWVCGEALIMLHAYLQNMDVN